MNLNNFLLKSISYNISLQFSSRVLTFILNALMIRFVSIELIGACNFQLALLYTTIIFLAREPFRRALSTMPTDANMWRSFVNTIWLVIPNGILLSIPSGIIWLYWFEKPNPSLVPYYDESVWLCCVACIIELCAEVTNATFQMKFLIKTKVIIRLLST
jgi:oligosaccharide translocation protein RFT1